ncbi:MAG: hypothetical protein Q9207_000946 [Kuettlingeria erythrocarpa]
MTVRSLNTPSKSVSPKYQKQAVESVKAANQEHESHPKNLRPGPTAQGSDPNEPTEEARKLQLSLQKKFAAQRRKDSASTQSAGDLKRGSGSRGPEAQRRNRVDTKIPVKEAAAAEPRRHRARRGRGARARARRDAIRASVGPKSDQKRSLTLSAESETAPVVAGKAHSAGNDDKRTRGPASSGKSAGMEQSTEVGKKSKLSSAQDGATQAAPETRPFLQRLKEGLWSLTRSAKADRSFRHVPTSPPSNPEKNVPSLLQAVTSGSQHHSRPTATKQSLNQLVQAIASPSEHHSKRAATKKSSNQLVQATASQPQHQSDPTSTEKSFNFRRIRSDSAGKESSKPRQIPVPTENAATTGDSAASNAEVNSDTASPSLVPTRKSHAGRVTSRPTSQKSVSTPPTEKSRARKRKVKSTIPKRKNDIQVIHASQLDITALDLEQPPVPRLSYGLERVLFNPGVYYLQDPRSRVYNFDPYLQTIMPAKEFDFNALKEYITSSRDQALRELADLYNKRYVGSSSSMTGTLAHFHFLLSQWRDINTTMLSRDFPEQHVTQFTELQRSPSAIFLKWRNGSYAIDADKEFASANILMMLGKSMEKLLTLDTLDFEKYRKSNPDKVPEKERKAPEAYHYSTMGDFIMRSQLDAQDPRLPGTGMFDLKTRAVVSVRMEAANYEQGSGYQIKSRQGAWESFEREYFDMIRSAFLKYSLQVRMGRMDGIFVAFHNTDRIFGFQYVSLAEMDSTLHGQWDTNLGDQEFKFSVALLNEVLDKATKKYPNTSLRLHFETRKAQTNFMYIFAEPVTEEQIEAIQTAKNAEIQRFEDELYGGKLDSDENDAVGQSWENLEANVQNAMDDDIRDPHHDEESQDWIPNETDSEQQNLKGDSSAVTHDIANRSENARSAINGNNESEDRSLVNDKEVEDSGEEETAIEDSEVESEEDSARSDEAKDDESERTGLHHGSGQNAEHPALDESTNVHEMAELDSLADDTASPETTPGNHAESQRRIDISELEPPGEKPSSRVGGQEVLALTLTIRNMINGNNVLRPNALKPNQQWSIEYSLDEVPNAERAWSLYQACQLRRRKRLENDEERSENDQVDGYIQRLRQMSRKGAKWRKEQDEQEKELPLKILGEDVQQQQILDQREN